MARDLALLPLWYAGAGGKVWVTDRKAMDYASQMCLLFGLDAEAVADVGAIGGGTGGGGALGMEPYRPPVVSEAGCPWGGLAFGRLAGCVSSAGFPADIGRLVAPLAAGGLLRWGGRGAVHLGRVPGLCRWAWGGGVQGAVVEQRKGLVLVPGRLLPVGWLVRKDASRAGGGSGVSYI